MLSNALTTGVNGRIMAVLRGDADDRRMRFLAAGLPAILGRLPTLEVAARCTVNNLQRHSASDPPGSPGGSAQRQDPARKLQGHLIVPALERISLIAARHPATWGVPVYYSGPGHRRMPRSALWTTGSRRMPNHLAPDVADDPAATLTQRRSPM